MKRLCDGRRDEIKADCVQEDQRRFCDSRRHEQRRRRMARFRADRRKPAAFGDA